MMWSIDSSSTINIIVNNANRIASRVLAGVGSGKRKEEKRNEEEKTSH